MPRSDNYKGENGGIPPLVRGFSVEPLIPRCGTPRDENALRCHASGNCRPPLDKGGLEGGFGSPALFTHPALRTSPPWEGIFWREMNSLNHDQIQQFIDEGFVRLDEAFPRDLADKGREVLWKHTGC